jgi:hypothetical protein
VTPEVQNDKDRLMAILVEAAGLTPPEQLRDALYDEMRDLRRLAAILRTMPLDQVESASTFRTPLP